MPARPTGGTPVPQCQPPLRCIVTDEAMEEENGFVFGVKSSRSRYPPLAPSAMKGGAPRLFHDVSLRFDPRGRQRRTILAALAPRQTEAVARPFLRRDAARRDAAPARRPRAAGARAHSH